MARLEDYSKDELIEMIEAYNLMTQIKNYQSMNKADLIKQIREKFDINEKGQIVSKELTAYPTEYKKKVADIADKPKFTEDDYNKIRVKIAGNKGTIMRIKDQLQDYEDIDKSTYNYKKLLEEKKNLEDKLNIEKQNLSKLVQLAKKIRESIDKDEKVKEEDIKLPKLEKMTYRDYMKYYFLKHKGESSKDMMKNASQSWKDIKDKDHTKIINEYNNLLKVKSGEKYEEKPKYGKKLVFDKDGLLSREDYRYVSGKRFELDKMMEDLKEKIDDLPKLKKYDKQRDKLNNDLQKLKDERKYYAVIFNKHITRQSEIDNPKEEDELLLKPNITYAVIDNEIIAEGKGPKSVKQYIKDNFEPPKKDIKGYFIELELNDKKNKDILFFIKITEFTITPKMYMSPKDDDAFVDYSYTKDELDKYGLNMDMIKKMILGITNNIVSFKDINSISSLMKKINKKEDKEDDIDNLLDNVKKVLEPSINHLFIDKEIVVSGKTMTDIKKKIKDDFDPPKKDIKGFVIRLKIDANNKNPLIINCTQITITKKLFVDALEGDAFQTFTFTKDELIKYGFKMDYIYKMMDAIKKNKISFEKSSISITELLKKTK